MTSFLQVLMILSNSVLFFHPPLSNGIVSPGFKKGHKNSKYNYRPVYSFMPEFFSKYQRHFRK